MTNCINCGAVLHGNVCEYCGTEFGGLEYGNFMSEKAIYLLSISSHGIKAERVLDWVGGL